MKDSGKKKALTFGGFVAAAHAAWGKRKATEVVRLAANARLIEFRGGERFVISEGQSDRGRIGLFTHRAISPTELLSRAVGPSFAE